MAYDNQLGGWYLLNPERDGTKPAGDAGSVTKVSSKKGYGIKDELKGKAKDAAGVVFGGSEGVSTTTNTSGSAAAAVSNGSAKSDAERVKALEAQLASAEAQNKGCNCVIS
jgi:hypothetical protein